MILLVNGLSLKMCGGAGFRQFSQEETTLLMANKSDRLHNKRLQSGFTLLELLVVLVIIGLLVGYVAPRYFSQVGKSEVKVAKAQIKALEDALDQYRIDVGRYPSSEQGLAALNSQPAGEARWQGPYLRKTVPNDPWGTPYQYRAPGEHGEFDLSSLGSDAQIGGAEAAADITNW
jgi:general secretion pathway protein G